MDKQYSVQFFTSFVEAMQKFCRDYIDFEQCVELSGYLAVEIDNHKKERYVLSEMLQSSGNVISESYCTKAFKTLRKEPYVGERDHEHQSPNHYRTADGQNNMTRNLEHFRRDSQQQLCSAPSRKRPNFVHTNQRMRRTAGFGCRSGPDDHRMSAGQIGSPTPDQLNSISHNGAVRPLKRDVSDSSTCQSEPPTAKRDKLDLALDDLLKAADSVSQTKSDGATHNNTELKGCGTLPVGVQVKTEGGADTPYMVIDNPLDADHDLSATDSDIVLDPTTSRFDPVTSQFDPVTSRFDNTKSHTRTIDTGVSQTLNTTTSRTFDSNTSRTYESDTSTSLSYNPHTVFDSGVLGVSSHAGGSQSTVVGVATADTDHPEEPPVAVIQDVWSGILNDRRMILTQQEEQQFCNLLRSLAAKGASLSRSLVLQMVSEFAVNAGKRGQNKGVSRQWYYKFLERWPEMRQIIGGKPDLKQTGGLSNQKTQELHWN